MLVFLSWSGERSRQVAKALENWIGAVIQAADPWISTDIAKGARWTKEISDKLSLSKVGIVCLTHDNLTEPWIFFEAGALSKNPDAHVCTFLLDVKHADVKGPLTQFQHTVAEREDVRKLMLTINERVGATGGRALKETLLAALFDKQWPDLEKDFARIKDLPSSGPAPTRGVPEILEEVLEVVRRQDRILTSEFGADGIETWKRRIYDSAYLNGRAAARHFFLTRRKNQPQHLDALIEEIQKLQEGLPEGLRRQVDAALEPEQHDVNVGAPPDPKES